MTVVTARPAASLGVLAPPRLGRGVTLAAVVFLAGTAFAATLVGADSLPAGTILRVLVDHVPLVHARGVPASDAAIVWQIRLPRVVLAGLVGAMLALAGATYQGVFANPLADPYLLGAASGAELGATLAIAYAPARWALTAVPGCAFVGAAAAVLAAVLLGRSVASGGRPTTVLVLAGVAVGAFLSAVETYVQQQHQAAIRLIYSYVLGRLGTAGWAGVRLVAPYLVVSAAVILLHRRHLDVLSLGDVEAASLGIDVGRTRMVLVVAATLGTAAAVAMAGTIAFVGIVVPHTIRLLTGASYRTILPLSALAGAGFLIACDLAARTLIAPGELPIGVITAFIGAPFFVALLRRSQTSAA